jgi:hypothetical protein
MQYRDVARRLLITTRNSVRQANKLRGRLQSPLSLTRSIQSPSRSLLGSQW